MAEHVLNQNRLFIQYVSKTSNEYILLNDI